MTAMSYGTGSGSIDVHTIPEILVEDTGTPGDDILVLHVYMVIDGKEVLVVLLHVFHVDEVTLGTTDPLDALQILHDDTVGISRQTVKEAHFEVVPHGVYDFLNLIVDSRIGHYHVIFKHDSILESLFEAPPVKLHVSHVAPDGPHVEVGHVGSEVFSVVVHLECLLEVHGVHDVLVLFGILYAFGVRAIDDLKGYRLVVAGEELLTAIRGGGEGQEETLVG